MSMAYPSCEIISHRNAAAIMKTIEQYAGLSVDAICVNQAHRASRHRRHPHTPRQREICGSRGGGAPENGRRAIALAYRNGKMAIMQAAARWPERPASRRAFGRAIALLKHVIIEIIVKNIHQPGHCRAASHRRVSRADGIRAIEAVARHENGRRPEMSAIKRGPTITREITHKRKSRYACSKTAA